MVEAGKAQAETVCSSCGSPIGAQAAFCDWCGSPVAQAVKQPSFWRRVITGGIALPFLGLAGLLFFLGATNNDHDYGIDWRAFLLVLGGVSLLFGAPFAIATVIPFGFTRRLLVGFGVGLLGFAFISGPLVASAELAGLVITLPMFAAFAYFGYRIAR